VPLYRIRYDVPSQSVLPKNARALDLQIKYGGSTAKIVIVNKNDINLLGQEFSKRLSIHCDFEADDIVDAINISSAYVNEILDQFALAVGSPVADPRVEKAYDITPGSTVREIWQFFYDPIEKVGAKAARPEVMEKLFFGFFGKRKGEILRSVHWFRLSLREMEPLDRFTYLWIGLESLNPIAQRLFPGELEVSRCPHCGHEIRAFKGTSSIRRLFGHYGLETSIYSKARRLRQRLLHGYANIAKITEEAIEIISALSSALRTLNMRTSGNRQKHSEL